MKSSDIQKLVGYGFNQYISVDLYYLQNTLKNYELDYGLDLNPDFQRGHVWSEIQQVKFIEFILRGGSVPPLLFNSPAWGGRNKPHSDLPETIVLVDGKQRLSAIQKFINNELKIFNGVYLSDFEDAKILLRNVSIMYGVNYLQTKTELLKWYLELNEGHTPHSTDELDRVRLMIESTNG